MGKVSIGRRVLAVALAASAGAWMLRDLWRGWAQYTATDWAVGVFWHALVFFEMWVMWRAARWVASSLFRKH